MIKEKSINIKNITQVTFLFFVTSICLFSFREKFNNITNLIFIFVFIGTFLCVLRRKRLKWDNGYILIIGFVYYSFLSSFWAFSLEGAFTKSISLLLLTVMSFVIYQLYSYGKGVTSILYVIMIAGIIMSAYTLKYYGFSFVISSMESGYRLGTEINQANILGIYSAYTAVICFYFSVIKNNKLLYMFLPLPIIALVSSGSRTGLIIFFIGIIINLIGIVGFNNWFKTVIMCGLIVVLFYFFLRLPFLAVVSNRIDTLFNFVEKSGPVDYSTQERLFMIKYGLKMFQERPLFGYGADSARYLLDMVHKSTYLHNNYIELLVNYGIIGFSFFYGIYFYLLKNLIQSLKICFHESMVLISLLIMTLAADIGTVSYYDKFVFILFTASLIQNNKHMRNKNKIG